MQIEIKTWLFDINTAIQEIETFISDFDSFPAFQNDLKTKRAVERNLEIIGEAMNRIILKNETILLSNARKIIDTRNRIIHGYDTISNEIIWSIVKNHLPTLKQEVETLLDAP